MQFTNVLITLLLSSAVMAKGGNKTRKADKPENEKSLCHNMAELTQLVKLAANTTKLESKTKGNVTKIAEIQAKASAASTKLTTMSSNTTLVAACAIVEADNQLKKDCDDMKDLTKLVALAANQTALDQKTKGNSTKIAKLQSKATAATAMLKSLESNTTLVNACSEMSAARDAKKAEKAAQKAAASGTADASTPSATGSALTTPSNTTNAAIALNAMSGGMLSTIVLVVAALFML